MLLSVEPFDHSTETAHHFKKGHYFKWGCKKGMVKFLPLCMLVILLKYREKRDRVYSGVRETFTCISGVY